jgi:hypothetical protein
MLQRGMQGRRGRGHRKPRQGPEFRERMVLVVTREDQCRHTARSQFAGQVHTDPGPEIGIEKREIRCAAYQVPKCRFVGEWSQDLITARLQFVGEIKADDGIALDEQNAAAQCWRLMTHGTAHNSLVGEFMQRPTGRHDRVGEADSRRLPSRCHVRQQDTMVKISLTFAISLTECRNDTSRPALRASNLLAQYREPRRALLTMAVLAILTSLRRSCKSK